MPWPVPGAQAPGTGHGVGCLSPPNLPRARATAWEPFHHQPHRRSVAARRGSGRLDVERPVCRVISPITVSPGHMPPGKRPCNSSTFISGARNRASRNARLLRRSAARTRLLGRGLAGFGVGARRAGSGGRSRCFNHPARALLGGAPCPSWDEQRADETHQAGDGQ